MILEKVDTLIENYEIKFGSWREGNDESSLMTYRPSIYA